MHTIQMMCKQKQQIERERGGERKKERDLSIEIDTVWLNLIDFYSINDQIVKISLPDGIALRRS